MNKLTPQYANNFFTKGECTHVLCLHDDNPLYFLRFFKELDNLLKSALAAQSSGDLEGAKLLFLKFLKTSPSDVAALYSLASIELQQGRLERGLEYINKAINLRKDFAPSFFARSVIFSGLSRVEEALRDAELASALDSKLPGLLEHLGRLRDLSKTDRPEPTGDHDYLSQLNAQGLALQNTGEVQKAKTIFEQVLAVDPKNFIALYSMGVLVGREPFFQDATPYLRKAVDSAPASALAHFALGTTLQHQGFLEQALEHFDQAIALDPDYIEPYTNKSGVLHALNRQRDAILTLEFALTRRPDDVKLLGNKGYLLTEFKENAAAAKCFDRVLELDKNFEYGEGLRAYAKLHACDWSNFEENREAILTGVREGRRVINPLAFMAFSSDARELLQCAKVFGEHRFKPSPDVLWQGEPYTHRALRVAFISGDFREHPVGYLFIELLENLRGLGIDTFGVSCGINDGSSLFKRYRASFSHLIDASRLTSREAAFWLRSMEVDIAIDLSGYTAGTRLEILSFRPCPRQLTYLGFPGTLALPFVDGIIADGNTIPQEHSAFYTEQVYRLGTCYLPRDLTVTPASCSFTRESFGLPIDKRIYCCFCHVYKISPTIFDCWVKILQKDEDGILWLNVQSSDARNNLINIFRDSGISENRVIFAERLPKIEDHLARCQLADVFIDTFPYNGHTTVYDALFAGVPTVTMRGQSFASRVGHSFLTDLGLTQWSCSSAEDFINTSLRVAHDSDAKRVLSDAKARSSWPPDPKKFAGEFAQILFDIKHATIMKEH